jgi:hypothetical protein
MALEPCHAMPLGMAARTARASPGSMSKAAPSRRRRMEFTPLPLHATRRLHSARRRYSASHRSWARRSQVAACRCTAALQIPSLRAKTLSPHRVRRVHAASTRRCKGACNSELAGDGIREATRDSEYEQRATGIGIERKGGQVQRVRVSQGVFFNI